MNESQIQGRLSWLGAALETRRNDIAHFLSCIKGLGVHVGTSLSLHEKFLHLMDQIAYDREKELDIIYEIETVEKRHCELKRLRLLRKADPEFKKKQEPALESEKKEKPHRLSLLEILALLFLFSPRRQKKVPKID